MAAAWGAGLSLVTGLPIAALMRSEAMLRTAGPGVPSATVFLVYVTATGAATGLVLGWQARGLAAAVSGGLLLGLLGWVAFPLTADPLLHLRTPTWSVGAAAATYPVLVGALLDGGITGAMLDGVLGLAARRRPYAAVATTPTRTRVVIIGGGFGGLGAAQRFERLALRGTPVDVTLISDSNFLLFTPMLAEVAAGALEATHISAPVRAAVTHTRFRQGTVQDVDSGARTVLVGGGPAPVTGSATTIWSSRWDRFRPFQARASPNTHPR